MDKIPIPVCNRIDKMRQLLYIILFFKKDPYSVCTELGIEHPDAVYVIAMKSLIELYIMERDGL